MKEDKKKECIMEKDRDIMIKQKKSSCWYLNEVNLSDRHNILSHDGRHITLFHDSLDVPMDQTH